MYVCVLCVCACVCVGGGGGGGGITAILGSSVHTPYLHLRKVMLQLWAIINLV